MNPELGIEALHAVCVESQAADQRTLAAEGEAALLGESQRK